VVVILGLSTFVLGLAIGPCTFILMILLMTVFMGPMSEFYGRKPVYIVSYFFFLSMVRLFRSDM
jgi:MFS family permease